MKTPATTGLSASKEARGAHHDRISPIDGKFTRYEPAAEEAQLLTFSRFRALGTGSSYRAGGRMPALLVAPGAENGFGRMDSGRDRLGLESVLGESSFWTIPESRAIQKRVR